MILYVGANHLAIGHMTGNVGASDLYHRSYDSKCSW